MLYDYLKDMYGENEPIFVADIKYGDTPMNSIRQQVKKLTDCLLYTSDGRGLSEAI